MDLRRMGGISLPAEAAQTVSAAGHSLEKRQGLDQLTIPVTGRLQVQAGSTHFPGVQMYKDATAHISSYSERV